MTRGRRICRAAPGPTHTQRHGYTVRATGGAAPKVTACPQALAQAGSRTHLHPEPAAAHLPHPGQTLGIGRITLSPGTCTLRADSRGDDSPCCAQLQFSLRNTFWTRAATTPLHGPLCLEVLGHPGEAGHPHHPESVVGLPWPLLHSGLRQNELKVRPLLFF